MFAAVVSSSDFAPPSPMRGKRTSRLLSRLSSGLTLVGAAIRVSRAVESRHEPAAADLGLLGLPARMPGVHRL